jgi:hypothetical protein
VDTEGKRDPKFKLLAGTIREIGIQGVRPLTQKETTIYKRKEAVQAFLGSLAGMPDETAMGVKEIRTYYCTWFGLNGVIAGEIRPCHENFFNWLGCA